MALPQTLFAYVQLSSCRLFSLDLEFAEYHVDHHLQFIIILLSKNPDVVQKLREEHDRVFGGDGIKTLDVLRDFPYKTNDLEYTTAVIKETLRLFPVGFGLRQADEGWVVLHYLKVSC